MKANDMKRVLLLVLLIVSLVELDWERSRIYFLSSLAALVLVVWSEILRCRATKGFAREASPPAEGVSPPAFMAYPQHARYQVDHFARVEPTAAPVGEEVVMHNNSAWKEPIALAHVVWRKDKTSAVSKKGRPTHMRIIATAVLVCSLASSVFAIENVVTATHGTITKIDQTAKTIFKLTGHAAT